MSRLLDIQDKLRGISAALAEWEAELVSGEVTPSLGLAGQSLRKRQADLEVQFLRETKQVGLEVCSYRLLPTANSESSVSLHLVSGSMTSFQRWFSVVYDAIKNGPKETAKLGADTIAETSLNFGYSFAGSVGMVFTMPAQFAELFDDSDLDKAKKAIVRMAKLHTSDEFRSIVSEVGIASIRSMYKWAEHHWSYGVGADIEWRRGQSVLSSVLVQVPEFEEIKEAILKTGEERQETIKVHGTLRGADLDRKTFHLVLEDETDVRGRFIDAITEVHRATIGAPYMATLEKTSHIKYATDEKEESYLLIRLE